LVLRRTTYSKPANTAAGAITIRTRRPKYEREAMLENRHDEIMYHVGRPGEDGYTERMLAGWGVDGHNSHTNICSSGASANGAASVAEMSADRLSGSINPRRHASLSSSGPRRRQPHAALAKHLIVPQAGVRQPVEEVDSGCERVRR